jgi:hypothetical protein
MFLLEILGEAGAPGVCRFVNALSYHVARSIWKSTNEELFLGFLEGVL